MPTISALKHLPSYSLKNDKEILWWETGRKIILNSERSISYTNVKDSSPIKIIDQHDILLGIGIMNKKDDIYLQPKLVLNAR